MAAAVADFRPVSRRRARSRRPGARRLQVELEPTADVIAALAERRRPEQTLVGFAAEHGERAIECGQAKLAGKRLDAVVVNDISRADIGFEVDDQRGHDPHGRAASSAARAAREQAEIAGAILDAVESLRADR